MRPPVSRIAALSLVPFLLAANVSAAEVDRAALAKLGPVASAAHPLLRMLAAAPAAEREALAAAWGIVLHGDSVTVNVAGDDPDAMWADMQAMGAQKMSRAGYLMSARIPLAKLGDLLGDPRLRVARPSMGIRDVGTVTSEGVRALRADLARTRAPGMPDGTGVRVGVLSDSFRCDPPAFVEGAPTTTLAEDQANGDLPSDYLVLDNGPCPATDEGRAMAQLIHDIAPGSTGAFHTAAEGEADYANGIRELAAAGADVIVDDFFYLSEPMFQDGEIAQAAAEVVRMGVPYFSAAGNRARGSYESAYRPIEVGEGILAHAFDADAEIAQAIQVRANAEGRILLTVALGWDQPSLSASGPPGAPSDLDLVFFGLDGSALPLCPAEPDQLGPLCQTGVTRGLGGDAVEVNEVRGGVGDATVLVAVLQFPVPGVEQPVPGRIKYVVAPSIGSRFTIAEFDTRSGATVGHANGAGVVAVGAAPFVTTSAFNDPFFQGACLPACLEPFSSAGGVEIRIDTNGDPLPVPENRFKPDVTGPDGANTTFFFADNGIDDDELPNFFGTSAAAPHVAAVAALLLDASEPLAVESNDGSRRRVCSAGRTRLVSEAEARELLAMPGAYTGFCLTPADIERALETTALDITHRIVDFASAPVEIPGSFDFDFDSGAGFVDAEAAVRQVQSLPRP